MLVEVYVLFYPHCEDKILFGVHTGTFLSEIFKFFFCQNKQGNMHELVKHTMRNPYLGDDAHSTQQTLIPC